jgi:hypothetical protein
MHSSTLGGFLRSIRLRCGRFQSGLEAAMHFIEQLFGLSPDGGSGLTELFLFLLPVVAGLLVIYRRRSRMPVK